MIIVSKMTSRCAGTVQMREESDSGIRKWEEMWFKTAAIDGECEWLCECEKHWKINGGAEQNGWWLF